MSKSVAEAPVVEALRWTGLTFGDREFVFRRELTVSVTGSEDGWLFESDNPEITGFALERQEALLAFGQDLAACWDHIACETDGHLTQDAIEFKHALRDLVKECRPVG
jgi:hypothetical protein